MESPVAQPTPFPPPKFCTAQRILGSVLTEIPEDEKSFDQSMSSLMPPSLERKTSRVGNILFVEETKQAYSLQRKIKDSPNGNIRVGFALTKKAGADEEGTWELVSKAGGSYEMVAVKIVIQSAEDRLFNEFASLQLITNAGEQKHLLGPTLLARESSCLYRITPYHRGGSLFDYCGEIGRLSEPEARFFFHQIVQGLEELQKLQLCNRSLSLDAVLLTGTTCAFTNFQYALRIPMSGGKTCLIEPQAPCGTSAQYVAPELLQNDAFDGYAVDLWSAGVMLFQMILGSDALFAAPLPEDPHYDVICVQRNLKGALARWMNSDDTKDISMEALDLLQQLLQAKPQDRLTLETVQQHPWVTQTKVTVPERLLSQSALEV